MKLPITRPTSNGGGVLNPRILAVKKGRKKNSDIVSLAKVNDEDDYEEVSERSKEGKTS